MTFVVISVQVWYMGVDPEGQKKREYKFEFSTNTSTAIVIAARVFMLFFTFHADLLLFIT